MKSTTWLRPQTCLYQGMNNFWMILFAAQAVVAVVAFLFENGKEKRFEDEKLTFRS